MTTFLGTEAISSQLVEIIRDARERLWLISPYLKVNPRLKQLLEDINHLRDIDARVIYGKNDLQPEESIWLEGLTSIRTLFCKDLHAKCYLNEDKALLTSMNLYEYSQVRNYEMGMLVNRTEEPELYGKVYEEARLILRVSEEIRVTVARVPASDSDRGTRIPRGNRASATPGSNRAVASPGNNRDAATPGSNRASASPGNNRAVATTSPGKPTSGFCLRCQSVVTPNPSKPYCAQHFRLWSRYKNVEYEEKYCHLCGKEAKSTFKRPACRDCFLKHKDHFSWLTS